MPNSYFGKIPDNLSFEKAVDLSLGMMTAGRGLFEKNQLGMAISHSKDENGKTLLVWGGSSSVVVNAAQLAVAAGYEVISIASSHNFDLCKIVGATQVFDHYDVNFIDEMASILKGRDSDGAFNASRSKATRASIFKIIRKAETKERLTSVNPRTESFTPDDFEMMPILASSEEWAYIAFHLLDWLPRHRGKVPYSPSQILASLGH